MTETTKQLTSERWTTDLFGRPLCVCGGATMDLAQIEPHPTIQHAEIRTYECMECGQTLVQKFDKD